MQCTAVKDRFSVVDCVQLSAWVLPASDSHATQWTSTECASQSAGSECSTGWGSSQWETTAGDCANERAGRTRSQWRWWWGWDEKSWLVGLDVHVCPVPAAVMHSLLLLVVRPFPCYHRPHRWRLSVSILRCSLILSVVCDNYDYFPQTHTTTTT